MLDNLDPVLTWFQDNFILVGFVVIAVLAAVYFTVRLVVVGAARWRYNRYKHHGGTRRILKPWTWFSIQHRALFKARIGLLSSFVLREFYAPFNLFLDEREKGRVYFRAAWLSALMDAARVSVAQNRSAIRGKHFRVRAQVAKASKHMQVRPLPDSYPVAGDRSQHYQVVLDLNRQKRSKVIDLAENILSAVEGESIETYERGRTNNSEAFIVHMEKPENILTAQIIKGEAFFKENPAKEWSSFPMAMDESGCIWSMPMTHVLIWGMTGSGKSSPLQSTIIQAVPFVERGEALLFGSDLKETELLSWDYSTLFKDIAFTADDSIAIINMLYEKLVERNRMKRAWLSFGGDGKKADLQRRLPATKRTPMMIFVIDELLSLLLELFQMGPEGKAAMATLAKIMALGRAVGVFVVTATQNVKQEFLGPMRDNFVVTVVLRNAATPGMNDMMLGEGSIERGFDPRKIEESTEDNDYKTSGIGYVKGETGDPKLVRFAFSDDEYISSLVRQHPDQRKMATLESGELEQMLTAEADTDDDINEKLAALSTVERNEFLESLKVFGERFEDSEEDDGEFVIEEV
ncbi:MULTISPECIES: FtsK/SpoIIIE domain-containing protein [Curtobacterium]|uniref:FtsK/SpoIIIE domain-containing protein n=1 Tax=Curtobacterium flaccumfaciens TaxID=2035 RepID=UPI003EE6DCAF